MRKSLWVALVLVLAMYAMHVPPDADSTVAGTVTSTVIGVVAPPAPREPVRLKVLTSMGVETTLTIDENTEVLVVATWCPVTRTLNDALRDPVARRYATGKQIVYLLAWDELDRYATGWVEDGEATQAEVDAYLASQPRGPRLYDRDFLRKAAANRILYFDPAHPLEYTGYPAAFSDGPNEFLLNYGVWMVERMGIPSAVKRRLLAAHGGA